MGIASLFLRGNRTAGARPARAIFAAIRPGCRGGLGRTTTRRVVWPKGSDEAARSPTHLSAPGAHRPRHDPELGSARSQCGGRRDGNHSDTGWADALRGGGVMYCSQCGTARSDTQARFCRLCGLEFEITGNGSSASDVKTSRVSPSKEAFGSHPMTYATPEAPPGPAYPLAGPPDAPGPLTLLARPPRRPRFAVLGLVSLGSLAAGFGVGYVVISLILSYT